MTTETDNQAKLEENTTDNVESNSAESNQSLEEMENLSKSDGDNSVSIDSELPSDVLVEEELEQEDGSASAQEDIEELESTENSVQSDKVVELEATILVLENEIKSLTEKLSVQQATTQNVTNQYTRLNADFDNFRRRTAKEKEDLEQQIKKKSLSELLSVVDNFERARSQIKPANDGEMAIHKSYQGVYKSLVEIFKRLGVSAMRPEGKQFDPNYHEAMLREETDEYPEGTVIEQLVRGYLLNDEVLRHAMVKVATSPAESGESQNIDSNSSTIESENNG